VSEPNSGGTGGLRIAITNPFAWPHVRRGSERLLNDLAAYLDGAGHHVTVIAMGPQDLQEMRDGVRYRLVQERLRSPWRQFNSLHYFAWRLQAVLKEESPQVVFCLNYFDAYAAVRCRARHSLSFRVLFQNVGIPTRRYFRAVPLDRWFMRAVLRRADHCLVLSRFAQERLRDEFGRDSQVLPAPVVTRSFHGASPGPLAIPGEGPVLLFVGDVDEPRKGARVLCRAFAQLKRTLPSLRLRLVGRAGAATQRSLLGLPDVHAVRDSIEFCGVGAVASLPSHFRAASVTVLPSVWEAFGLVLVESLAAGTPVVGARHGGISDIVQGELVGALFDPGAFSQQSDAVQALADALMRVLQRGKTAEVMAACRARAEVFSWERLGPAYLSLIEAGSTRSPA
jgi:phosphatidyl-myo-inositol alpha-mannosyltransferase